MSDELLQAGGDDDDEGGGGAPGWMVTFGDMMSLLLTFFVLLLSYSTMDITKFQMLLKSIKVGFGSMSSTAIVQPNVPVFGDDSAERSQMDEESDYLAMRVEELIDQADLSSAVEMTREEAGILIRVRGQVFFEPGLAEILMPSKIFLERFSGLLREFPHHVMVRGHTDDSRLPPTSLYPTNWELSAARASSVVRELVDAGDLDPKRFVAMGFGHTRPLVPNDSPDNRNVNRRVEFILVNQNSTLAKDGVTIF